MTAYLTVNPPATRQWYEQRNRPLTGCTVLHSSESVMDTVGPDTGAEAVAAFIRGRTTPGSYHGLVDSDSRIHLVEYRHAAFHDGTGSNNWALSISFALRTVDWARMTLAQRAGFLRQGALEFVAQQQYRKQIGAPLTRLRYISKAQSDEGESGFCCHGWRDPLRRSDPGTREPVLFPFAEWLDACAHALGESMPHHPDADTQGGFLMALNDDQQAELYNLIKTRLGGSPLPVSVWDDLNAADPVVSGTGGPQSARALLGDVFHHARAAAALAAKAAAAGDVDEAAIADALAPMVVRALGEARGITADEIEAAVRRVFASVGTSPIT